MLDLNIERTDRRGDDHLADSNEVRIDVGESFGIVRIECRRDAWSELRGTHWAEPRINHAGAGGLDPERAEATGRALIVAATMAQEIKRSNEADDKRRADILGSIPGGPE